MHTPDGVCVARAAQEWPNLAHLQPACLGNSGHGIGKAVESSGAIRNETAQSAQNRAAAPCASLKQVQAFQQAVGDHRFLSEHVANVQHSTAPFEEPLPHERIAAMEAFLAERVIEQFALEEEHILRQLPASEGAKATRQAALELVDEHNAMKIDVSRLRQKMSSVRASGTAQAVARLEDSSRDFLVVLQARAVKDDNILLGVRPSRRRAVPLR